jgi:hypothetical protein
MNSARHGDSAPKGAARVSYCCRFFDLDAFGLELGGVDTDCFERCASTIAVVFSILTHSA